MACPEAVKLMRRSQSSQTTIEVPITSVLLVPYSANRVSLVISSGSAAAAILSLKKPATGLEGLRFLSGATPLRFNIGEDGDIVHGPIYALSTAGTILVTFWETQLPPNGG